MWWQGLVTLTLSDGCPPPTYSGLNEKADQTAKSALNFTSLLIATVF